MLTTFVSGRVDLILNTSLSDVKTPQVKWKVGAQNGALKSVSKSAALLLAKKGNQAHFL